MLLFRKRPIVIEAIQYTGDNGKSIQDWALALGHPDVKEGASSYEGRASMVIRIPTLEGVMLAGPGDWIICGIKNELYPCKPDIFSGTYEPATERYDPVTERYGPKSSRNNPGDH